MLRKRKGGRLGGSDRKEWVAFADLDEHEKARARLFLDDAAAKEFQSCMFAQLMGTFVTDIHPSWGVDRSEGVNMMSEHNILLECDKKEGQGTSSANHM